VDDELMHELVAAYALHALEPEEERAFERHLAQCVRCQIELAELGETSAALGFGAPAATPPPELRDRVLAAAGDRSNVVPLRPRWAYPVAAVAAVASCAAVGLGIWAGVLDSRSSGGEALQTVALRGAPGTLVLSDGRRAALVVAGLPPTPAGKTYEAWVVLRGKSLPAGLFTTRAGVGSLELTRAVPRGAVVAVTLERAGGASTPTGKPLVTSARV
jgi:anti-sigma-K factor RskA